MRFLSVEISLCWICCLTGFAIWAPGSVVIKAFTALLFSNKKESILNLRNLLMLLPAAILCAGGYYLYESMIYGNFVAPLAGIPASFTQSAASSIVFVIAGLAMDKMKVKSRLIGGNRK